MTRIKKILNFRGNAMRVYDLMPPILQRQSSIPWALQKASYIFSIFSFMATVSSVSFSNCLFLSYSALSLSSHEPCPLLYWALVHLQQAFISLSWSFIRTCLEIFNHLSQIWAYDVFITFGLSLFIHLSSFFFFFWKQPFSQNISQPSFQSL